MIISAGVIYPYTVNNFKFQITISFGTKVFTLPLTSSGEYNFIVSWGDGKTNRITSYNQTERIHTYASNGTYTIELRGICTEWDEFARGTDNNKTYITNLIEAKGNIGLTKLNFYSCYNIYSIPNNFFDTLVSLTNINRLFHSSGITTIPSDLFKYNINITTFDSVFASNTLLTTIPSDLFKYNVNVTSFSQCFVNCTSLTTIPSDLFKYNVNVTSFFYTFSASGISSVPVDLFKYNVNVTSFNCCFYACLSLQLNASIFYTLGDEDIRFLNKDVTFDNCFERSSYGGAIGTAPALWACSFGTGDISFGSCFYGEGNSLESLTNYNSIPSEWK